jgi:preprotein translocase subunit YajC
VSDVFLLVLLALPIGFIWLVVVRPTQRRNREAQELSESLQIGQRVMTTSGLFGSVTNLDQETVVLEVADGVRLRFARRAVGTVIPDDIDAPG